MKYIAYNTIIESDIDLGLPKAEGETQILIKKSKFLLPKLSKTKIYRAGNQAFHAQTADATFLSWPGQVDFKIQENFIEYQADSSLDEGLLRIFITSEALGTALFLRGMFLLHGSAVVINNKAQVYIGTPGAGKSTTVAAFAKAGFSVLSDDMVALKLNDSGEIVVVPAFADVKIWQDAVENLDWKTQDLKPAWEGKNKYIFTQENFDSFSEIQLSQVNIIKKPNAFIKIPVLGMIEYPVTLLKYFPLAHQLVKGEALKNHFLFSIAIAKQAAIIQMRRTKNFEELKKYVQSKLK